ncbi:hypothetical protein JCM10207_005586 [Rhodosporidiobolus poonsookiae]
MSATATDATSAAAAAAADPATQAALLAAAKQVIDKLLAPVVIASFLSCTLCGAVLSLAVTYYARFPNDRLFYKLGVAFLTCMAMFETALFASWTYHWAVDLFMDVQSIALWPWQLVAYAFVGFVIMIVQFFFAWRVWIVSGRTSYLMTGVQVVLAIGGCALAYYMGSQAANFETVLEFSKVRSVAWAWLAVGLANDIFLTLSLSYYLIIRPRKMASSEATKSSPLAKIVLQAFQTNAVSLFVQLLVLILICVQSDTMSYAIPGQWESKIYVAAVIATLNARKPSDVSTTGHGFSSASFSGPSTQRTKGFGAGDRNGTGTFERGSVPVHIHVEQEEHVERHPYSPRSYSEDKVCAIQFVNDDASDVEKGRSPY